MKRARNTFHYNGPDGRVHLARAGETLPVEHAGVFTVGDARVEDVADVVPAATPDAESEPAPETASAPAPKPKATARAKPAPKKKSAAKRPAKSPSAKKSARK